MQLVQGCFTFQLVCLTFQLVDGFNVVAAKRLLTWGRRCARIAGLRGQRCGAAVMAPQPPSLSPQPSLSQNVLAIAQLLQLWRRPAPRTVWRSCSETELATAQPLNDTVLPTLAQTWARAHHMSGDAGADASPHKPWQKSSKLSSGKRCSRNLCPTPAMLCHARAQNFQQSWNPRLKFWLAAANDSPSQRPSSTYFRLGRL